MFEMDNKDGLFTENDDLDLGNDLGGDFSDFSAFGDEKVFKEEILVNPINETSKTESEEEKNETTTSVPKAVEEQNTDEESDNGKSSNSSVPNLFEEAIAKAEEKQAKTAKSSLSDKLPIFSYANATEEIVDTSKTFDALRDEKSEDFPELDDATAVTWKMVYGTITKNIATPKKITIASLKKQIEDSKEFLDSLKKAKEEIVCKVTPSVTAKKKGIISSYKGVFNSVDEAVSSGKVIAFVPSDNGKVYEVRSNRIGTFIAETDNVSILRKVRAGFIPALPKIPYSILAEIISFFKTYVTDTGELEAMANIYWSFSDGKYYVHVPRQQVSKASINTNLPEMDEKKFLLVMEIHSHNTMEALFSPTDNRDERATRLYSVIGRLDKLFPDVTSRISVGGKFIEIDPSIVFEGINSSYPAFWNVAVETKHHKNKEGDV